MFQKLCKFEPKLEFEPNFLWQKSQNSPFVNEKYEYRILGVYKWHIQSFYELAKKWTQICPIYLLQ